MQLHFLHPYFPSWCVDPSQKHSSYKYESFSCIQCSEKGLKLSSCLQEFLLFQRPFLQQPHTLLCFHRRAFHSKHRESTMCFLLTVISIADTQVYPLNSDSTSHKCFTHRGRLMNTLCREVLAPSELKLKLSQTKMIRISRSTHVCVYPYRKLTHVTYLTLTFLI